MKKSFFRRRYKSQGHLTTERTKWCARCKAFATLPAPSIKSSLVFSGKNHVVAVLLGVRCQWPTRGQNSQAVTFGNGITLWRLRVDCQLVVGSIWLSTFLPESRDGELVILLEMLSAIHLNNFFMSNHEISQRLLHSRKWPFKCTITVYKLHMFRCGKARKKKRAL